MCVCLRVCFETHFEDFVFTAVTRDDRVYGRVYSSISNSNNSKLLTVI